MPTVVTRSTYLEVNSIPLATPAWDVLNVDVLWNAPDVRGTDRLLPGASGVRARKRRPTVTKVTLEMIIKGARNWENTVYASPAVGLETNVLYLRSNVTDVLASSDSTVVATLHNPSGGTKTGSVHVEGFKVQHISYQVARATLDLSIPGGALA